VVGVVFIFLQNWRATIIPVIAIPVSLVGTFTILAIAGASINNLSTRKALFDLVLETCGLRRLDSGAYPWRRTRRSRAPSNGPDAYFVAQFSAGYTTNMFGFDLRQGQAPVSRQIQRIGSIKSHAILGGLHHHYARA